MVQSPTTEEDFRHIKLQVLRCFWPLPLWGPWGSETNPGRFSNTAVCVWIRRWTL